MILACPCSVTVSVSVDLALAHMSPDARPRHLRISLRPLDTHKTTNAARAADRGAVTV